jgi:hypothetical protein
MTEDGIRDELMRVLYKRIGVLGSWTGEGKGAAFQISRPTASGECAAEKALTYALPGGKRIGHCSDVLVTFHRPTAPSRTEYISIEIKHLSAVTDQFKCRSFDMLHLKKEFGPAIVGVMLFARGGQGISLEQARAICYPFDHFTGVDTLATQPDTWWNDVAQRVEDLLDRATPDVSAGPAAPGQPPRGQPARDKRLHEG